MLGRQLLQPDAPARLIERQSFFQEPAHPRHLRNRKAHISLPQRLREDEARLFPVALHGAFGHIQRFLTGISIGEL